MTIITRTNKFTGTNITWTDGFTWQTLIGRTDLLGKTVVAQADLLKLILLQVTWANINRTNRFTRINFTWQTVLLKLALLRLLGVKLLGQTGLQTGLRTGSFGQTGLLGLTLIRL